MAEPHVSGVPRGAVVPLAVLTAINLLNYIDRNLIAAMLPSIQGELSLNDTDAGLALGAFIWIYALASPLFGRLGDRGRRTVWITVGVGIWSVATGLAGFARGFWSLLVARSAVGVGEAAYGSISPSLIADYWPKARRGFAMAIFSAAIPVGSALGYLLGGVLGKHLGWRPAFFIVGFPGLLLALSTLMLREPQRGAHDDPSSQPAPAWRAAYREIFSNRLYLWTVLGYTAYTFAIGGLAAWTPSYMMRVRGYDQAVGMLYFGGITVVTGIVGTLAGGWLGDRLLRISRKAYTWVGVVAMFLGGALTFVALRIQDPTLFLVVLAAAEILLFLNTGPINALLVNTVRPEVRATAVSLSILTIHLLGDAISPVLIGSISDRTNLQTAMLTIPAVFFVAGILWATTLPKRRTT